MYRYEYDRAVREGFLVDYDVVKVRSNFIVFLRPVKSRIIESHNHAGQSCGEKMPNCKLVPTAGELMPRVCSIYNSMTYRQNALDLSAIGGVSRIPKGEEAGTSGALEEVFL